MKIKEGFAYREIMGQAVVVPVAQQSVDFNGMLKLNETGALIWKAVEDGKSTDEIVQMFVEKFEVTNEKANEDIEKFMNYMKDKGFFE